MLINVNWSKVLIRCTHKLAHGIDSDIILRGRYIYGRKAEKHQKVAENSAKPEKGKIFCGKPEKRSVPEPENDIFESWKN